MSKGRGNFGPRAPPNPSAHHDVAVAELLLQFFVSAAVYLVLR